MHTRQEQPADGGIERAFMIPSKSDMRLCEREYIHARSWDVSEVDSSARLFEALGQLL